MSEFNAQEFLDIGIKLAEGYTYEAGYRTAIGRVYYACHLIGIDSTVSKGWYRSSDSGADHSGLLRALKDNGKEAIADKLRELFSLREHADYHTRICSSRKCLHCELIQKDSDLVDANQWENAKEIAVDILPKLKAIQPTKSSH